ncbi:uncharacterized protein LOC129746205 isoform X2 [Uranotaenia lowii]|uniref:uncharacterized protein LOC129746205 isoform X2 n=1 Tax=Uranotaenia lowii TaxID=190385 RepID=UPI00247849F3|nr:uncharacterized protein LOC129746205 isoform X2 [Uranotaenia lowii]XP_055595738.1 uncharacterized protein LOC129746205 isoform X2 [Uranotaenia lowii]
MPCMKRCCFYFSTRLGSIVIGIFSILQSAIPFVVFLTGGGAAYLKEQAVKIEQRMDDYDQERIFTWALKRTKSDPDIVFAAVAAFLGANVVCAVVMIVGAYKIQKYLLLPFIVVDFVRLSLITMVHVIAMMVIKKSINLGDLIAITIAGGFGLLFFFYLWACVLALYQIIGIVNTKKYRDLFGNDATKPEVKSSALEPSQNSYVATISTPGKNSEFSYNSNFTNQYLAQNRYNYAHLLE